MKSTVIWMPGMTLDQMRREVFMTALAHCNYHKKNTAKLLGISTTQVYTLIKTYSVTLPGSRSGDRDYIRQDRL